MGDMFRGVGRSEGEPGSGKPPDAGPRAHADLDPAEVLGRAGGGVHQGEEHDSRGANVLRPQAQLRGQHLWARGYFASTIGRDEQAIREYIRSQEAEDKRQDQLRLVSAATFRWLTGPLVSGPQLSRRGRLTTLKPPALPGDRLPGCGKTAVANHEHDS
jgi:hypothetical protein